MTGRDRRGIPFVVAAPSGTGKTTVCRAAVEREPRLRFSVSHTTRTPREGERDGIDYHFVSPAEFRRAVENGEFLEHAEYAGHLYGTSWRSLDEPLDAGYDLLLEIEVQGARQVRDGLPDARFVFLLPPSMADLEARLRGRGSDAPDAIERRLAMADRELSAVHFFDYALVNDDRHEATESLLRIVAAERKGRISEVSRRFGRARVFERWLSENAKR